jgi:hypothetical protein
MEGLPRDAKACDSSEFSTVFKAYQDTNQHGE